jgi:SAM-dependent MidA family methyltransferase
MQLQTGIPELCDVIRDRIERSSQHRITFAQFMELALYHPQHGYYARQTSHLGIAGDFVTAAHLGNDFAELLAEQFIEMWQHLGRPHPFQVVEFGPGQGLIADAILNYLHQQAPDCLATLQYILIETSPALQAYQQQRLQPWKQQGVTHWCRLADLPPDYVIGCCFSNELVDALPVHRVTLTATGWQEQYVTLSEATHSAFKIVLGSPSTPAISHYFEHTGIEFTSPAYAAGFTTEVNLAALDWLTEVATKLHQGYVLTIDYGYSADRYYSPARSQGTLQCYTQHAHHDDPLINVGQQDITAHVDFTALEQQGTRCGLETLGLTQQGLFLMALGLGDRLNALAQLSGTDRDTLRQALQRRETLHQLINPMGLGKFLVLLQGKGFTSTSQRQLKGFTIPPLGA